MRYAATNMMAKGLSKGEFAKEVKKRNPNFTYVLKLPNVRRNALIRIID